MGTSRGGCHRNAIPRCVVMSQGWGDISPHATMHWGLGGTPIHGGQGHHGMDGTETPPRCASGCHGVTPWQMGDSEPPYNEGVSWEGLGGSSPCGLGGQWVFWVTSSPEWSPVPHAVGCNEGTPAPTLPMGGAHPVRDGCGFGVPTPHSAPHTPPCSRHQRHFLLPFPAPPWGPTSPHSFGAPPSLQHRLPTDRRGPSRPQLTAGPLAVAGRLGRDLAGLWSHQIKPSRGSEGINFIFTLAAGGGGWGVPTWGLPPSPGHPSNTPGVLVELRG